MKANGKTVVVGLGVSGRAVCALLRSRGAEVFATDLRPRAEWNGALDEIERMGCRLTLGSHRVEEFLDADRIVVSPGIPLDIEPLEAARKAGKEIVGELDWAWGQVNLPTIAVTGTNGKTTTTALIGEMLRKAGKNPFVGGNIGTPLSRWILSGESADLLVLEVSSFQLDTASAFRPDSAVLLNVTEDHLDRYPDFEAYGASKLSIFKNQSRNHFAVLNATDPICLQGISGIASQVLLFGAPDAPARVRDDAIRIEFPGRPPIRIDLSQTKLRGAHNRENIMAAALAALSMKVPADAVQAAVDSFSGFPHRVEWVRSRRGVDFYDDSKGTNVGAVVKALEGFERPVLLLLGGRDKLGSYEPLVSPLLKKGKAVFAFGEAGPGIFEQLSRKVPEVRLHPDLESAFRDAAAMAAPGDVVLLSPACSSFDQYQSYGQRGDHFKKLASELGE